MNLLVVFSLAPVVVAVDDVGVVCVKGSILPVMEHVARCRVLKALNATELEVDSGARSVLAPVLAAGAAAFGAALGAAEPLPSAGAAAAGASPPLGKASCPAQAQN